MEKLSVSEESVLPYGRAINLQRRTFDVIRNLLYAVPYSPKYAKGFLSEKINR